MTKAAELSLVSYANTLSEIFSNQYTVRAFVRGERESATPIPTADGLWPANVADAYGLTVE